MKAKTRTRTRSRRAPARRNRKLQSEGFRMPATLTLVLVLGFGVGVFYLWVCSRNEALAREIRQEESRLEELRQQVSSAGARWSEMTGPRRIQQALARHQLQMAYPRPDQNVQIQDMGLWEANQGELHALGRVDRDRGGLRVP